jgi:exopolyphosphatase / guanosine-5'-triphosphate,3'-diphosphate pyrophosphatase
LNIDIGGGSTELSLMSKGTPRKLFSMPVGAVGLTEKFIRTNPPRGEELANLRAEISFALAAPAAGLKSETWQIAVGTSGTILNLAALLNFQGDKPRIELEKLSALNEMLARISLNERARLPVISPQRAEVIVAGGQILETAMRALGIENLTPCAYALREGVIIDYLRQNAFV